MPTTETGSPARAVTVMIYTRYEYRKVYARVHLLGETHLAQGRQGGAGPVQHALGGNTGNQGRQQPGAGRNRLRHQRHSLGLLRLQGDLHRPVRHPLRHPDASGQMAGRLYLAGVPCRNLSPAYPIHGRHSTLRNPGMALRLPAGEELMNSRQPRSPPRRLQAAANCLPVP